MKFTITREQLQEGLSAVAASVPTKTTLPVLANILVEATQGRARLSGTDLDIAVSTTVPAVGRPGRRHHPAGQEAGGDRARVAQRRASGSPRRRAAGHHRVRPVQVQAARACPGRSSRPSRPSSSTAAGRPPPGNLQKLDQPRGVRRQHRGEPPDPQRRALGAPARPDADGGHQRPPAGEDGRARRDGGGAQADLIVPPKALEQIRRLFGAEDEIEDGAERQPPRLPLRRRRRSSPG